MHMIDTKCERNSYLSKPENRFKESNNLDNY